MRKSSIIAIVSGLAILGLGLFAVVELNNTRSLSFGAVVLSLVPMYFLYSAVVLGKYDKNQKHSKRDYETEKSLRDKKTKNLNKSSDDYGKVLKFPDDKKNKDDNKNDKT